MFHFILTKEKYAAIVARRTSRGNRQHVPRASLCGRRLSVAGATPDKAAA
jgi:hypothetical protein